jgi:GntR family transcriptional repressor for pyruvate dehydrogenase complex
VAEDIETALPLDGTAGAEAPRWLRDRLVNQILADIRAGHYAPGQRLPSERQLAAHHGISRVTVRDAFRTLVGLRAVHIERGRGVFVDDPDRGQLGDHLLSLLTTADVRSLFEIRRAIEPSVAAWAASRATAGEADSLFGILRVALPDGPAVDPSYCIPLDRAERADRAFHYRLVQLSKNPVAERLLTNLLALLEQTRQESARVPGRMLRSAQEHWRIAVEVSRGDALRAREVMIAHLCGVEESILTVLRDRE